MSVFEWITEHEGFFSGLVAIAALLGISAAATRLLWVRARGLKPKFSKLGLTITAGGFVAIAVSVFVVSNLQQSEIEPEEALRSPVGSNYRGRVECRKQDPSSCRFWRSTGDCSFTV